MASTSPTPSSVPVNAVANPSVADLSYEQARDELIRVVSQLEQGSSTLEQSLELWERGEALAGQCERWLIGAKARLDAARIAATSGSTPRTDSASPAEPAG